MSTVEERLKQLDEMREKVRFYETQMDEFLQQLGWTKDKLPKFNQVKQESNAAGSQQSANRLKQHVRSNDLEEVVNLCSEFDQKRLTSTPFTDLNKLKRDLKRRRVKYRTTKTAPLTYTEELRELINLQMELVSDKKEMK